MRRCSASKLVRQGGRLAVARHAVLSSCVYDSGYTLVVNSWQSTRIVQSALPNGLGFSQPIASEGERPTSVRFYGLAYMESEAGASSACPCFSALVPGADRRLIEESDGKVAFWARAGDGSDKTIRVERTGVEFVRLWSLHILPKGFTKSRFFWRVEQQSASHIP